MTTPSVILIVLLVGGVAVVLPRAARSRWSSDRAARHAALVGGAAGYAWQHRVSCYSAALLPPVDVLNHNVLYTEMHYPLLPVATRYHTL